MLSAERRNQEEESPRSSGLKIKVPARSNEQYFIGSADWMTRNLTRRVEVVFPVFDEKIRSEIRSIIDTELKDNVKARILDVELSNRFRQLDGPPIRSQKETYCLVEGKAKAKGRSF